MKTAVQIWDDFVAKKINIKQAFELIDETLKSCDAKEKPKLLRLSEKLLDRDIPMEARDSEAEKVFWDLTHRNEE